jgi:cyclin B
MFSSLFLFALFNFFCCFSFFQFLLTPSKSPIPHPTPSPQPQNTTAQRQPPQQYSQFPQQARTVLTRTAARQVQTRRLTPYETLYQNNQQDPQFVFDECESIYLALLEDEQKYKIQSDYMLSQTKITIKYREVLIDWLSSVRGKYQLKIDTFALCISILDRFLEKREIDKDKLQLVGCTALWIASKYEEIYPPDLEDLIAVSDRNFSRDQFIMMERIILTILDFRITVPYAHHFAERFIAAIPFADQNDKVLVTNISLYILESSYQHYNSYVGHLPSQLAAAAVSLSLYFIKHPTHYPELLIHAAGYRFQDIRSIFCELWFAVDNVHQLHQQKKIQTQQGIRPIKVFDSVMRLYNCDKWSFAPTLVAKYDEDMIPE